MLVSIFPYLVHYLLTIAIIANLIRSNPSRYSNLPNWLNLSRSSCRFLN